MCEYIQSMAPSDWRRSCTESAISSPSRSSAARTGAKSRARSLFSSFSMPQPLKTEAFLTKYSSPE